MSEEKLHKAAEAIMQKSMSCFKKRLRVYIRTHWQKVHCGPVYVLINKTNYFIFYFFIYNLFTFWLEICWQTQFDIEIGIQVYRILQLL